MEKNIGIFGKEKYDSNFEEVISYFIDKYDGHLIGRFEGAIVPSAVKIMKGFRRGKNFYKMV